ncbi:hypothetical protein DPMN_157331 [Dreissena polymorpha]|uniref:Uncharacterized protein n=1 Tax=Dreissena polymorpha TaxID=45954 RepID=A0A9D4EH09_DREPO|nr:hypothetical protein DPMN_157331 [Dreissena polymorpha]
MEGCTCESFDVSFCHDLERVELSGGITLQPNAFHGLAQLNILKLKGCKCKPLDLSSCLKLSYVVLSEGITLQPNILHRKVLEALLG